MARKYPPWRLLPFWVLLASGGCLETSSGGDAGQALPDSGIPPQSGVAVEIGTPDEETGLEFVPLEKGGEIPLETFGQGGTHAALAVRCLGFGNRAFVDVTIENLATGDEVMTLPASRPPLLLCRDEARTICDMIPLNVLTGGLADPDEKDGLAVRVTAVVHNEAGEEASAQVEAVLRQKF